MLFLPGARGDRTFWRPVADLLPARYERVFLEWPGHGSVPPDPRVSTFDDVVSLVTARMVRPVDLIAQSMGGAVAIRAALDRPEMVRHLVLSATSGGVDLSRFDAEEWRASYRQEYPKIAASAPLVAYRADLSERIRTITAPTLLLWGDSDPISPVAAGEYLASLLPRSELIVILGGSHMFAEEQAAEVAPYIASHLALEVP
ncbi:MAG TPA: alpha/beta hydrolase [bacterium]|nr:alpha/beta hydrolase [bacterium]